MPEIIALEQVPAGTLALEPTIVAVTLAELVTGPYATDDTEERARRQDRLRGIEALLEPLPFGAAAARVYGLIYASTRARERKLRGARAVDLLIAVTALANDLSLFIRNPGDFDHLGGVGLEVRTV